MTIWAYYSPYYLARLAALESMGCEVVGFSYCAAHEDYPFFNLLPRRHEQINDCTFSQVRPLQSFRRTLALLNRHRPDLVLSCGYERPETAAALAYARMTSVEGRHPGVLLMMDNKADDHPRPRWKEAVKSRYLKHFDGFVISGSLTREYLAQLRAPMGRVCEGYNCVDNDRISKLVQTARRHGQRAGLVRDYFLCVARLVPKKNLAGLIRAYALYNASTSAEGGLPWQLVICGEGPVRGDLEAAIASARVGDDVVLAGQIDDLDTLASYYAFARTCVLASTSDEPWGLVINEAMAAGLPVLVSNHCGCAPDLVEDGRNGFSFDPGDEGQLAAQMRWMHTHRSRLAGMGAASCEIVQRFSPAAFAANVLRLAAWEPADGPG
ncbi:MAG: glycosyltransferase family 4 protein [Candidatus Dormibacteraeota bacterium]|nr:glycosyltransferase family 4 protein [Candidatus Dormibacteraeota bacterium]